VFLAESELWPCVCGLLFGGEPAAAFAERLTAELERIDSRLRTRTFLVGERLSLADVSVFCSVLLVLVPRAAPTLPKLSGLTNLRRWFETVSNTEQVKRAMRQTDFDVATEAKRESRLHERVACERPPLDTGRYSSLVPSFQTVIINQLLSRCCSARFAFISFISMTLTSCVDRFGSACFKVV
jgi:hypothetical protein